MDNDIDVNKMNTMWAASLINNNASKIWEQGWKMIDTFNSTHGHNLFNIYNPKTGVIKRPEVLKMFMDDMYKQIFKKG